MKGIRELAIFFLAVACSLTRMKGKKIGYVRFFRNTQKFKWTILRSIHQGSAPCFMKVFDKYIAQKTP